MKAIFEIEWPDEHGPAWINVDNLKWALEQATVNTTNVKITNVTKKIEDELFMAHVDPH